MNTDFGELFRLGGDAPKWRQVADRKQAYAQGQVPQGVNVITAGVDVQKNRLVYVVRGWGKDYESWLLDYGEFWGETDKPAVWQRLSTLSQTVYELIPLSWIAIDSGYQTAMVYDFCRQHPAVSFPTKGHDYLDKPFYKATLDVNGQGKARHRGLSLWHFNSDQMKSWVHGRIEWPVDQPGGFWLPEDISEDYCQQLVAEERMVKPNGKAVWVKVKKDNHYLDAEALSYLAVRILSSSCPQVIEHGVSAYEPRRRRLRHPGIRLGMTPREVEREWLSGQRSMGWEYH